MANYTTNLHLKLPLGSKYWNLDTHNENMKILDKASTEIKRIRIEAHSASNITYEDTNVQDVIDEIATEGSWIKEVEVTSGQDFLINPRAHCYLILKFGSTVPPVSFASRDGRNIDWLNGQPSFAANSIYELSFLDLACIWAKTGGNL